jgi:hypothetical protein
MRKITRKLKTIKKKTTNNTSKKERGVQFIRSGTKGEE